MRHAMQIIKADQGDDAVILSNIKSIIHNLILRFIPLVLEANFSRLSDSLTHAI